MDGGYYAIKGFEYQIDKSILEVLSSTDVNQEIAVEQIQDINSGSFVMQIKYKEATKLTPSVIRKPIIQLINEYKNNPNRDYILYCYFYDTNGYSSTVDLEYLDNILGKEYSNYSGKDKTEFLRKFKLIFSPKFHDQFQNALLKFQKFNFCNSKEEAVFYYSIVADFIRKKVVDNPPDKIQERKFTKKEVLAYLSNGRKIVFTSAFKEYRGEKAYLKFLQERFKKPMKNHQTFIIFGLINETESTSISEVVYKLIVKHYHKATQDIKPLNIVLPDPHIEKVKKYLIKKESSFNDGYETLQFSEKLFFSPPIINRKMVGKKPSSSISKSSFYSRILSESTFKTLKKIEGDPTWILINSDRNPIIQNQNYQLINGLNTDQTLKLF